MLAYNNTVVSYLWVKDIHDLLHMFSVSVTSGSRHSYSGAGPCMLATPYVHISECCLLLLKSPYVQVSVCQPPCVKVLMWCPCLLASNSLCLQVSMRSCVHASWSPCGHMTHVHVSVWTHLHVSVCPCVHASFFYIRTGVILKNYNFTGNAF